MSTALRRTLVPAFAILLLVLAGCSDDSGDDSADGGGGGATPTIVVTHSLLGDVVENVVGDEADVEVIMPAGADPHEFQPSAAQVATINDADLVIANGLGFEQGLTDTLEAAEEDGVTVVELGEQLDPLAFAEEGDEHEHADEAATDEHEHAEEGDEHAEEGDEHADEAATDEHEHAEEGDEHAEDGDEHAHEHGAEDPHWFTDPQRTADAALLIGEAVVDNSDADADAVTEQAQAYADEVLAADAAIEEQLSAIPEDDRVLVTNHEVFGYFADRYGFEVLGAVIPSGTTLAEPSSSELTELLEVIEEAGVPAIFADTSSSQDLADVLAQETGEEIVVVELFTESLGDSGSGGETYLELIQTNADRITDALT